MINVKEFPVLFENKEECCGCSACFVVCPNKAIYLAQDREGFEYPYIIADRCICCYKCINVCDFKTTK